MVSNVDDTVVNFLMELGETQESKTATIFNLTSTVLDDDTIKLLAKGLKFVATPIIFHEIQFQADLDSLSNNIKRKCSNTWQRQATTSIVVKPSFKRLPKPNNEPTTTNICRQIGAIKPVFKNNPHRNMEQGLYNALSTLKSTNIIIKEADKGSGVVLMEREFYVQSINTMLQDTAIYEGAAITCTMLADDVEKFTKQWKHILLTEEVKIINNHASSIASIYGLPKIHKSAILMEASRNNTGSLVINYLNPQDLKFRPIISCRSCPTYKLCEVLNNLLQPFLIKVKYRLRDTWDFLKRLPTEVEADTFLITGDITSLYTNITTDKGCEAISYFYDQYASQLLPSRFTKEFILDLFTFCQEHLYFTFEDAIYRQISGTGMGRTYAPAAADIKVGFQEVQLERYITNTFGNEAQRYFSRHYFRYLDDVFLLWRRSLQGLDDIKNKMNTIDSNIKFIFESSDDSNRCHSAVPFLDVEVWIEDNKIQTDIYNKSTDTFNYLPFSSSHPRHCVRNIPYSLARRIRGIVSNSSNLELRMEEMKKRLISKGYPADIINDGIKKALELSREEIIQCEGRNNSAEQEKNKPIYYVSTHNATIGDNMPSIQSTIAGFNATRQNQRPIVVKFSRRRSPSLKDHLMFRTTTKRRVRKCGKNCLFCQYIFEGESLKLKNGIVVTTNGDFECGSRNVLYIAVCMGCHESYLGETGDKLLTRWTVHRQQSKLQPSQAPVHADVHFRLCGNNRYQVFPFFRPKYNDINLRRRFEEYFIKKFRPLLNGRLYN